MAKFHLSESELRQAVSEWTERRLRPGYEPGTVTLSDRTATVELVALDLEDGDGVEYVIGDDRE